jgi:hypothetical protein
MSATWPNGIDRMYYCSLCRQWYGGGKGDIHPIENPNQDKIDDAKRIEDPTEEQ